MALADLQLHVRPVADADASFFYETRRACFRPYTEALFGPWLEVVQRPSAARDFHELPLEIVEHRGAPIGYLVVEQRSDHLFLSEIALIAQAQRRGFGTALVHLAMDRARSAGLPLRLSVLVGNPAQQLYLRLGFAVTRIEHPRVKMSWTPEPSSSGR